MIEIFSEIMNFIKTAGRTEEYAENISLLYKKLLGYVAAIKGLKAIRLIYCMQASRLL